jgi:hypothetical protein
MFIEFPCPACGHMCKAHSEDVGKHAKCHCGHVIEIPAPSAPTEIDLMPPIATVEQESIAPLPPPVEFQLPPQFASELPATSPAESLPEHVEKKEVWRVVDRLPPLPTGAAYGNASTCFVCGQKIANGEARFRREVRTGHSSGQWVSRRSFGAGGRTYFSMKTLCVDCARRVDSNGCAAMVALIAAGPIVGAAVWWLA